MAKRNGKLKASVPPYVDHLANALKQRFRGAEVDFEPVRRDRYLFTVTSKRFDQMMHPERQQLVWSVADEVLQPAELLKVAMILTVGEKEVALNA